MGVLQFAFGNPRKSVKSRKKRKKKVAKLRKTKKTKKVTPNRPSKKAGKAMAKKHKRRLKKVAVKKSHKRKHRKTKKNPVQYRTISKTTKKFKNMGRILLTPDETSSKSLAFQKLKKAYKSEKDLVSKRSILKQMAKYKHELGSKFKAELAAEQKTMARYLEANPDLDIARHEFPLKTKGSKVAKRKKAKKAKKAKRAKKSKVAKKARKHRRKHKKHAAPKKAKRAKKSHKRRHKRRKRAKVIKHSHSENTRHVKRGQTFRGKISVGKGKRKRTLSIKARVNPRKYGRNPMGDIDKLAEKHLGLSLMEIGTVALAGIGTPIVNNLSAQANSFLQSTLGISVPVAIQPYMNAVLQLGAAAAIHHIADMPQVKSAGPAAKVLGVIGEATAISAILNISMQLAHTTGLAGVIYTPSMMAGVNYTPTMRGVNYTPNMRGMGDVRFTPNMRGTPADFGAYPTLGAIPQMGAAGDYGNYNAGLKSPADFGRMGDVSFTSDGDFDEDVTEDDITDDNLSGVMG